MKEPTGKVRLMDRKTDILERYNPNDLICQSENDANTCI